MPAADSVRHSAYVYYLLPLNVSESQKKVSALLDINLATDGES